MAKQSEQIARLKQMTGLDFRFVPIDHSPYRVASYVATVPSSQLSHVDMGALEHYQMFDRGDNADIILVDNAADAARMDALSMTIMQNKDDVKSVSEYTDIIGVLNGHNVYLEPLPTSTNNQWAPIVIQNHRAVVVVNINGARLPFYVSSGLSGKESEFGIAQGKWYPLMGISATWLNKMPDMKKNPYMELDKVAAMLEKLYPAAQLRDMALRNDLPTRSANEKMFDAVVNAEFPEGVNNFSNPSWGYHVNKTRYLPRVMRVWRGRAADTFTRTDALKNSNDLLADKISKNLTVDAFADDGFIFFNSDKSQSEIVAGLSEDNIEYTSGEFISDAASNMIGLRADAMQDVSQRNAKQYAQAIDRITKKTDNKLMALWHKIMPENE